MPKLQNGSKGGIRTEHSRLRVRHSTAELPRSTHVAGNRFKQPQLNHNIGKECQVKRIQRYRADKKLLRYGDG